MASATNIAIMKIAAGMVMTVVVMSLKQVMPTENGVMEQLAANEAKQEMEYASGNA